MAMKRFWCLIIMLALVLALPWGPASAAKRGVKQHMSSLEVQLKVQSITKESFYLGSVWVAPAQFTDIQMGEKYVGNARAVSLDQWGNPVGLEARWQPSDPAMVTVSPDEGPNVEFTVLKAGRSELRVSVGHIFKKLSINAVNQGGAIFVEILQ